MGAQLPAVILDLDPFSEEFLSNPYPAHERLRDAGSVVRLNAYGIWAMARYAEVNTALRDWQTYCSGRGVGLSDFAKETPWRPPSLLLEADPPLHDRTREVVKRVISRNALMELRPEWEQMAVDLVDKLVARGEFDGIADLAEVYPLRVFPDAVGVLETGRENLLPYSETAFNAFGPRNALTEASLARAAPAVSWVNQACKRESLRPGGFGARTFEAVESGEVTEAEAERLVRSFLTAGVDTTVNGLGNLLLAFAEHPEQWQLLRQSPRLLPQVFDEVLRYDSTVQTFFRTTTREVDVAGVRIPEGEKVLLFLAAANRDPRKWENPERFDITRRAGAHVGFGVGIHTCVGQMIARNEAELVLKAMLARVGKIELTGRPERRLNNTLRSLRSLPLRLS